jgi:hypothetical protein
LGLLIVVGVVVLLGTRLMMTNQYLFQYLVLLGRPLDLAPKRIFFSKGSVWWIALISTKEYQDFNLLL